jgi:hypothetical protein
MHLETIRLALLQVAAFPVPASAVQSGDNTGLLILVASFISQVKVGGVAAALIQWVKMSKAPAASWISINTPWMTRLVALAFAAAASVGIHWTFTGNTLVVAGLSLTAIVTALWSFGQSYLMQHAWYKTVFSSFLTVNAPQPAAAAPPPAIAQKAQPGPAV